MRTLANLLNGHLLQLLLQLHQQHLQQHRLLQLDGQSRCDESAFHQLPVADSDIESTAFVTEKGKYCFKRLSFGVCNAPWLYQRVMSLAPGDTGSASSLFCYMDDLVACSATWDPHVKLLDRMFSAMQKAGLTLKPSKM